MLPVLDFLLPEGDMLIRRSRLADPPPSRSDAACWEIPMLVLVNRGTYGAAEYFAAILQEYGWASVMGAPTAGKGYEQTHIRLRDGSALWLSTNEYFTPQGRSLAGTPLRPDIPIPAESRASQVLMHRSQDNTLAAAEIRMNTTVEEQRRLAAEEEDRARG